MKTNTQIMQELLTYLQISGKKLAENIGTSPTHIYNIISGRYTLTKETAKKIVKVYPDVNLQFLTDGIGNVSDNPVEREKYHKRKYNTVESLTIQLDQQEKRINSLMAELAFLKDKLNQIYASVQR